VHFRGGDNAEAQPVPLIALLDSGYVNAGPGQDNFWCHAAALAFLKEAKPFLCLFFSEF
jgi:hypothetical protein